MSIENKQARTEKNLQTLRGMADAIQTGTFTDPAKKYVIDATSLDTHIAGVTKQTTLRETILEKGIPRLESRISKLAANAQRISEAREKILSIKNAPDALVNQLKARFEADFGESFDPSTPSLEVKNPAPSTEKSDTPSPIIHIPTPEEKHDEALSESKIIPETTLASVEARKKPARVTVDILGETYEVTERTAEAIELMLPNRDISIEELAEKMNISVGAARASRSWAKEFIAGAERLLEKTKPEAQPDTAPEENNSIIEPNKKLPTWLQGKKGENATGLKFWETPLFANQIAALNNLLSDTSLEDVLQSMGKMKDSRRYHRGNANRSLSIAIAKLKQRVEKNVATEDEKNIWEGFSNQLPESHTSTDIYSHVRAKLSEKMGFLNTALPDDKTHVVSPEPLASEPVTVQTILQAPKMPRSEVVDAQLSLIESYTPEIHITEAIAPAETLDNPETKALTPKETARLAIITKNLHGVSLDFGSEKTTFNIPDEILERCSSILSAYKNGEGDETDVAELALATINRLHEIFGQTEHVQAEFVASHPEAVRPVLEWLREKQDYILELLDSTIRLNPVIAKQLQVSSAQRIIHLKRAVNIAGAFHVQSDKPKYTPEDLAALQNIIEPPQTPEADHTIEKIDIIPELDLTVLEAYLEDAPYDQIYTISGPTIIDNPEAVDEYIHQTIERVLSTPAEKRTPREQEIAELIEIHREINSTSENAGITAAENTPHTKDSDLENTIATQPSIETSKRKKLTIEDRFMGIGAQITEQTERVFGSGITRFSARQLNMFGVSPTDATRFNEKGFIKAELFDKKTIYTQKMTIRMIVFKKIGADKVNTKTAEEIGAIIDREVKKHLDAAKNSN